MVLSRSGNFSFNCKVGEEFSYLLPAHFFRISFIMENNIPVYLSYISLFCAIAEMICANYFPDMAKNFDPFICR